MQIDIQYTDGVRESVDHTQFYKAIKQKDIYRFSIGTADFYNHDFYSLEDKGDHLLISEWDLKESYPEQNWTQDGHACVYQVFSPTKWRRTQYGQGTKLPWNEFTIPTNNFKIVGILVSDTVSDQLRSDWGITRLAKWGEQGF